MENEKLYETFINESLAEIATSKNIGADNMFSSRTLFGTSDEPYENLEMLQRRWKECVPLHFARLVRNLLEANGLQVVESPHGKYARLSAYYKDANALRVAFFVWPDVRYSPLCSDEDCLRLYAHTLIEEKMVQSASIVWLVNDDNAKLKEYIESWNETFSAKNIFDISVTKWFENVLSRDEAEYLKDTAARLRMESRRIQGLSVAKLPSQVELASFRVERMRGFVATEMDGIERRLSGRSVSAERLKKLKQNFIDQKRYGYLFGASPAADSFISSEWRFFLNEMSDSFEQTGTVAGYIKTIEQMLFDLLKLWTGRGLEIALGTYAAHEELTNGYLQEHVQDAMLGNLHFLYSSSQGCSFFNDHIYEPECDVREALFKKLRSFKRDTRNGKFHKSNFKDIKTVIDVRNEVLDIVFLLLGSLKLDESQLKQVAAEADMSHVVDDQTLQLARTFNLCLEKFSGEPITHASFLVYSNKENEWVIGMQASGGSASEDQIYVYNDTCGMDVDTQVKLVKGMLADYLDSYCTDPSVKQLVGSYYLRVRDEVQTVVL